MQVWLFLTPVIYSADELEGNLQLIYRLNPTVGIIDGFRKVLVFGQSPDLESLAISFLVTIAGLFDRVAAFSFDVAIFRRCIIVAKGICQV